MKTHIPLMLLTAFVLGPDRSSAQAVELRGEIDASARVFPEASRFGGQTASRVSPSVSIAPELVLESPGGSWRVTAEVFARLDAHDGNRSHIDVRELGLRYLGDSFTAFAGFGQVFWGVTEVRHLVDVVNQVDAVEDLDGEDKLGQPMLALTLERSWWGLDLYYLPYFRERTFPAADGRLRGPLPVADHAVYASGQGRWHPGFAGRAFATVGPLDIGLSAFEGTSREPRFALASDGGAPVLRAEYDLIDQVGLDAQWTGERTLLKLEAMTRGGHGERLYALTAGIEHTLYQIFGTNGDLGLLGEVMFDSRASAAPPTPFDHDIFLGGRWALNDIADTSVLGGPSIDLRTGEVLVFLEAERRIGSDWRASVEARLFANAQPGSSIYGIRNDGYVSVSLKRFF